MDLQHHHIINTSLYFICLIWGTNLLTELLKMGVFSILIICSFYSYELTNLFLRNKRIINSYNQSI